ncbi:MAG: helix-turn-helix domain-containing protein [Nostoc sp.]
MIKSSDKNLSYAELLQAFPPRPIRTEEELLATQSVIDSLIDNAPLTPDQGDYLSVLGTLVYKYEQTQKPVPDIYGVDLLKALMEEFGLRQKDLTPVFKTESIVSDILKRKRKLTIRHIQELAQFFDLSPAVFLPLSTQGR